MGYSKLKINSVWCIKLYGNINRSLLPLTWCQLKYQIWGTERGEILLKGRDCNLGNSPLWKLKACSSETKGRLLFVKMEVKGWGETMPQRPTWLLREGRACFQPQDTTLPNALRWEGGAWCALELSQRQVRVASVQPLSEDEARPPCRKSPCPCET